jgi:hypothetical protein
MPTLRRIVEIATGEDHNLFRTIRLDVDLAQTDEEILAEWADILEAFRRRYETQIRFVWPSGRRDLSDFAPPMTGEDGWDWGESTDLEF